MWMSTQIREAGLHMGIAVPKGFRAGATCPDAERGQSPVLLTSCPVQFVKQYTPECLSD